MDLGELFPRRGDISPRHGEELERTIPPALLFLTSFGLRGSVGEANVATQLPIGLCIALIGSTPGLRRCIRGGGRTSSKLHSRREPPPGVPIVYGKSCVRGDKGGARNHVA
mmetsp:Transcript_25907/g.72297  ORF Transcript_25907/g.72297 Transcript_25907/m.72297 type:complete len:111 (-) Transcript_25907:3-335(-)